MRLVHGDQRLRAGEAVLQRELRLRRLVDVVRGDHPQPDLPRQCPQLPHEHRAVRVQHVLQLDEESVRPQQLPVPPRRRPRLPMLPGQQQRCQLSSLAAREDDQPLPVPLQRLQREPRLPLPIGDLRVRHHAAQVPEPLPVPRQQHQVVTGLQRHLRAHDRQQPRRRGRLLEPHRPIQPVVVRQRQRPQPHRLGALHQRLDGAASIQ